MRAARRGATGLVVAAVIALAAAGCGQARGSGAQTAAGAAPRRLSVLAASSLDEPFRAAAAAFTDAHPGVAVDVSPAGSQTLVTQLAAGAPADVLATADTESMRAARDQGLVAPPRIVATNTLVVVTPAADPAGVGAPSDLARPGVRLVIAAPEVPAGRYARAALERLGIADAAAANVVSEEQDVRGVLGKVVAGEADAGIVYATDVTERVADQVRVVDLHTPEIVASYPVAVTRSSASPDLAAAFVAFLLDGRGAELLADAGFGPP